MDPKCLYVCKLALKTLHLGFLEQNYATLTPLCNFFGTHAFYLLPWEQTAANTTNTRSVMFSSFLSSVLICCWKVIQNDRHVDKSCFPSAGLSLWVIVLYWAPSGGQLGNCRPFISTDTWMLQLPVFQARGRRSSHPLYYLYYHHWNLEKWSVNLLTPTLRKFQNIL